MTRSKSILKNKWTYIILHEEMLQERNEEPNVKTILIKERCYVNIYEKYGPTPVCNACRRGHLLTAWMLIEKGADMNSADRESIVARWLRAKTTEKCTREVQPYYQK